MGTPNNKFSIRRGSFGFQRIIKTIFSIVVLILAFRFILKLFGANSTNGFVQGLYDITQPCVGLFEGIFTTINTNLVGIHGIFEPATAIAIVTVSVVEWILFKLISR